MKPTKATQGLNKLLLSSISSSRGASVFTSKDFRHLGSPVAIRKALERLVKRGELSRVHRGAYYRPRAHPLLGKTAPDPMDLVRVILRDSGARGQVSGAYAANLLHLSDQVPAKIVILTDGVSRRIPLGKLMLDFRRTVPRHLLGAGKPAGLFIQAIRYLRPTGITPNVISVLRRQIDRSTRKDLVLFVPKVPVWMQPVLEEIIASP
jgi:hypothetical protein